MISEFDVYYYLTSVLKQMGKETVFVHVFEVSLGLDKFGGEFVKEIVKYTIILIKKKILIM